MTHSHMPKGRHSFWFETGYRNDYPSLREDLQTGVGVVGGGIAGILAAYTLVKEGHQVILLEGRKLVSGTTGYTTAKLSAQHQLIYKELLDRYDADIAKLYYEANMEGIAYIKKIVKDYAVDCHLEEQSAFVYTQDQNKKELFKEEAKAYEALGIKGRLLESLPFDSIEVEAALQMDAQAQFQPVSFLHHVLDVLKKSDVQIYENSLVVEVKQNKSQNEITLTLQNGNTVTCSKAVFATQYPTFDPENNYASMEAHMSYGLALKTTKDHPEGMYINDDLPKRTFRQMKADGENYLLVGGQSHPIGDDRSEMARYQELVEVARETFGETDVIYRWSSHDLLTKDRIPFIGLLHPDYPNIYTLTGFNKWGLANSAVGAKVIADLINQKKNRYEALYNPQRKIPELEKENQAEYEDAISPIHLSSDPALLKSNEATIIEENEKKIGVYKDTSGIVHRLNIECTHLGCGLSWNDGDATWDCPCHGSRFNATGEVIAGPALTGLKKESDG